MAALPLSWQTVLLYRRGAARQRLNFWKVFVYFYQNNL
jgi:hypothetical protein